MNSPIDPDKSADLDRAGFDGADLDWLAWLYVSSELGAAEIAAFEARLLADTAACEAVARAVELSDLMAAALTPIITSSAGLAPQQESNAPAIVSFDSARGASTGTAAGWSQRLGWMALGAAACLAVMLAGRNWQADRLPEGAGLERNDAEIAAVDEDTRLLADVWTELWNMDDALSPVDSEDDAIVRADSVLAAATSDPRDSAPPDWLLAAVADQNDGSGLNEDASQAPPVPPQPN